MKNKDKKKVSEVGWMPFWWGSKFNRRLSSKRVRQYEKKELEVEMDLEEEGSKVTHWMPLPELPKMKGGAE